MDRERKPLGVHQDFGYTFTPLSDTGIHKQLARIHNSLETWLVLEGSGLFEEKWWDAVFWHQATSIIGLFAG